MAESAPPDWKPVFLEALEDSVIVQKAIEAAGVGKTTAYAERKRNRDFADAWDAAIDNGVVQLEDKLRQVALEGGGDSTQVRALDILLRAHRPEKYRDNMRLEHGGRVDHGPDLSNLSDDDLIRLLDKPDDQPR